MKVGIVITVKNEERLLRNNLLYHNGLGVDRAFVYLDNTTDGTKESIEDLSFVEINPSVEKEKYANEDALSKFFGTYSSHHTARQCLNTYDAKQKCKESGIDWLISIDADELIVLNKDEFSANEIQRFFKQVDPKVDEVNFRVYEAFSTRKHYENVMAEETLFKKEYRFERRLDKRFKYILNPFTKEKLRFSYWYGQNQGKSAIRVKSDVIPRTVHRYTTKSGAAHNRIFTDCLLHYHAYDKEDFVKKFTNMSNHPDTHISGRNVEALKILWRNVVNNAKENNIDLETYFEENIMFSNLEIKRLAKKRIFLFFMRKEVISRISSPKIFFTQKVF